MSLQTFAFIIISKEILLALLALASARPSDDELARSLWEPSDLCPPMHTHHLLPHEWDCSKFYYCEYGMKYIRPTNCAPGTVFSYEAQVCVHTWAYNCKLPGTPPTPTTQTPAPTTPTQAPTTTPTQGPTTPTLATTTAPTPAPSTVTTQAPSGVLPNGCPADFTIHHLLPHKDCDKFYYCLYGETIERQCPAGTYFNYRIQDCDWPENVECLGSTMVPTATPTLAPTTPTLAPTTAPTPAPSTVTTQTPSGVLPNGCPADFTIHHLLPHKDCDKFYYCLFGETVERQCPAGTYFNYRIQDCDWPENVECLGSTMVSTKTPTVAPTTAPTPAPSTVTTQTPSGVLPNGCPADFTIHHLLPHKDCDKFYYCLFGETVERQCPAGTYFNYRIQDCDWPENVECLGSTMVPTTTPTVAPTTAPTPAPSTVTTQTPSGVHPNGCPADFTIHHLLPHKDCDKFYYCLYGETIERQCPAGTYFNYRIQDCDWPENVECLGSTMVPTATPTLAPTTSTLAPTTAPTPAPSTVTTQAPSGVLPNGCPADFTIHHLLPHKDCDKFYYCLYGETIERQCPAGTYFNYRIQDCDWPENVECLGSTMVPTATPTLAPTTAPTPAPSTVTTQPPSGVLPNGCPADFTIHHLLPHKDCDKFYYCLFGETVERQCPAGTYFNYRIQDCDWPENVECLGSTMVPTTTPTVAPTTAPTPAPSTVTTQTPSGVLPNGCPADFTIHHLLPHKDCDKFYYCLYGETIERQCPAGTYFNYRIQDCDWPENVECLGSTMVPTATPTLAPTTPTLAPTTAPTPAPSTVTTQAPSGVLPNGCPADFTIHHLLPHKDCDKFYYCLYGETVESQCPAGTYFNYRIQVCDWPENVDCAGSGGGSGDGNDGSGDGNDGSGDNGGSGVLPNGCPADWDIHHLLPHETECDKFYYCLFGDKVERQCAPGTHFNPAKQVCDWPAAVGCTGNNSTNENGGENVTDSCQNNCLSPWAHATDCDKYWRCDRGKTTLSVCSEGLHFNPVSLNCDFICNAGCVRVEAQTTMTDEGIKLFLPWNKVDSEMARLIELSTNEEVHHKIYINED